MANPQPPYPPAFKSEAVRLVQSGEKSIAAIAHDLDVGEAYLVALACTTPPAGRQRWMMQLLAEKLVMLGVVETTSDETVRVTLKREPPRVRGGTTKGQILFRGLAPVLYFPVSLRRERS